VRCRPETFAKHPRVVVTAGFPAIRQASALRWQISMRNPFARDLILLHAPALFDFRTRETFLGPMADAVPSTAMFEMYPVGPTSIAAFLERNHYNVEIVNLAYRMLRDRSFDVAAHIARMRAPLFGIDLHWLPHVQGALSVAELVKQRHPESRVVIGGLSATYYHKELIRDPSVDFVMRGDSTEEPMRELLQALREGTPLHRVANLTWKEGARSRSNRPTRRTGRPTASGRGRTRRSSAPSTARSRTAVARSTSSS
jgi:hypothetical protein